MSDPIEQLGAIFWGLAVVAGCCALLWFGLNDILAMVGL